MNPYRLLALDKWAKFFKILKKNGGLFKAIRKCWIMDTLKDGQLMGVDEFGNKYYENKGYMIGTSRWVEYANHFHLDYDASQVPPKWFGWLHYKTDLLPSEDCAKLCIDCTPWTQCWMQPHLENYSGTKYAYYPYSTTRRFIHVWDGMSIGTRCKNK